MAVLTVVPLSAMLTLSPAAAADPLSSAQQKAAQLETQIQTTGMQIDALDQQYLAAEANKTRITKQITATKAKVAQDKAEVSKDRAALRRVAVRAYITDGGATGQAALFFGNQTQVDDAGVFHRVATGSLGTSVATLQTAQAQLGVVETTLQNEDRQAAQAVAAAQHAYQQAQTLEAQQTKALQQEKGQIANLIAQQQAQRRAQAEAAARAQLAAENQAAAAQLASTSGPPPPSAGGAGAAAVAAAESQLGVPYVWGAESPGQGFDCSGLTAWAWGQAGVPLPHFSGAQMADSTPVPLSDLQPGDLLFYGPSGDTHVAMYVGNGAMIEAPYTGAHVWITSVRLGANFAGAGRP